MDFCETIIVQHHIKNKNYLLVFFEVHIPIISSVSVPLTSKCQLVIHSNNFYYMIPICTVNKNIGLCSCVIW
jgi:hypothetical protein